MKTEKEIRVKIDELDANIYDLIHGDGTDHEKVKGSQCLASEISMLCWAISEKDGFRA